MQISSNTIPEKKNGLERQVQNNLKTTETSSNITKLKKEENLSNTKSTEHNETSQYLKVLSRIESLLFQEKLPDAALDGFVGAIKKQIEVMGKEDRQIILNLPEAMKIELENLENLPEMIRNNIRDEDKSGDLLKFLRIPKFAALMQSDSNRASETYSVQTANNVNPSKKDSEIKILEIPRDKEKIMKTESPDLNQVKNDKKHLS